MVDEIKSEAPGQSKIDNSFVLEVLFKNLIITCDLLCLNTFPKTTENSNFKGLIIFYWKLLSVFFA